jgi:hypothetical protein
LRAVAALILVAAGFVLPAVAVTIAAVRRDTYIVPVFAAGLGFFVVEAVSLLLVVVAALSCDDGCEDPPEVWRDDPDAWQWDAIAIAGVVSLAAGAVALFALAFRRRRLAAWALVPLLAGQLVGWALAL